MKAVIHIGTHKTGTTTIQRFLYKNSRSLGARGVFVPESRNDGKIKRTAQHNNLCAAALIPDMRKTLPIFALVGYRAYHHIFKCEEEINSTNQSKLWEKIRNDIETNSHEDDLVLFSAESFSYFTPEEVEKLKHVMNSLFDEITIVLYLRRQPEYLVSHYGTHVVRGSTWNIFDYLECPEDRSLLAYHKLVERWSIFGKDKLKIRIFDRQEFQDNDLLADFASTVGFDIAGLDRVEDANVSWDSASIEFLRLLNSRCPAMSDSWEFNRDWRLLTANVRPFMKKGKKAYYLNRCEARRIIDQFEEGNDWIAREYLGREKLFSEDVSMYPEEVASPHHLTLEQCAEITAALCQQIEQRRKKRLSHRFKTLLTRIKEGVSKIFGG